MQHFLEKTAAYIHQHYEMHLSELCIVLPNRRAKLFLKNFLSTYFQKPVWAPALFSIEDFIIELVGTESIDSLTAAFEFYEVYTACEKENAKSFDDFLRWGPTLLQDFNEIDQYLVDAPELFTYLSDERAISLWNVDGKELSDFQKKYLLFWKSLGGYYVKFLEQLDSKKLVYPGRAYRMAAENAVELASKKNWHKIIFAGFNALNTSEQVLFKKLGEAGMADILWDADEYYVSDENQEAGVFIRKFAGQLGKFTKENSFLWQDNLLLSSDKNISIAGVSQQIGQAKVAGELLDKLSLSEKNGFKNHALVLADENLLMPVLHSIPESVANFNVTMGYPLNNVAFGNFIELIFRLQENAVRFGKSSDAKKVRFYFRDLKAVFHSPFMEILLGKKDKEILTKEDYARNFIQFLERESRLFISFKEIQNYFNSVDDSLLELLSDILKPWENNPAVALQSLSKMIETIHNRWTNCSAVENEILFHYLKITKRIQSLVTSVENKNVHELKSIHSIFTQLVSSQSVAFIGEPLEGLQIMGMLETRTLDFETVILLSANEGVLPAGKKENSFIPFELKNKFGLPTYQEKDAIFGYHFYRLLQRAKNIFLIYNTETDEFGSGEKSRFLAQVQQEMAVKNSKIKIEEKLYSLSFKNSTTSADISIEKDDFVKSQLKKIMERGLSPSLFNTFRNCSLQFYFSYIGELREKDEPEEHIDAATFGTVIHAVLEECYSAFVGKVINSENLKSSIGNIHSKIEKAFQFYYKGGELKSGKNLLNLKVAEKYIASFFEEEIKFLNQLKQENNFLTLLHSEKELSHTIHHHDEPILVKGKVDRIDKIGNVIRIIDYKTGAVKDSELKLKSWMDLEKAESNKSFQLLMYAYLFNKNTILANEKITSGILSFRQLKGGLKPVFFNGSSELTTETLMEFETYLLQLVKEIFNLKSAFTQTSDRKICDYCDFKMICNR